MSDQLYILAVLVAYKVLLLGVGVWAQRRVKTTEDLFLGGRGLGGFVAALSYSASSSSAWKLLGFSGLVFVVGFSAIWLMFGSILGAFIAWYWLAPRLYQASKANQSLTLTEFLCAGLDEGSRRPLVIVASIIVLISFTLYVAAQFQGAGNMFSATFDLSLNKSIVLGALIIFIYTVLGGFWAVSVTDAIQGLVMAFATLILPIAAVLALGGPVSFIQTLALVATPEQLSLTGGNLGLVALGVIVGNMSVSASTLGQPHMLVRFMALKDESAIRTGRRCAIAWYLITDIGVVIVGLAGLALQTQVGNPENLFFTLTGELFHPLIAGVITAAILSAIMSTADSQLLVSASAISHDLNMQKRFASSPLAVSRLCILFVVVFSVVVTLLLPEAIFSRALFAWVALGASFGPLIIVNLCNRAISADVRLLAMLTGFSLAITFYLLPNSPGDILERALPFTVALAIAWFGSKRKVIPEAQ